MSCYSEAVSRILEQLEGVRGGTGGQYEALCPAHEDRRASLSIKIGTEGQALLHCHAGCSVEAITAALGLAWNDLFDEAPSSQSGEPDRVYDYTDEQGLLLYQVCRFFPKAFRPRTVEPDGSFNWKLNGVRRVLYRLPLVVEATAMGKIIFVVEGEKDADALTKLGFTATTAAGGAGKWRSDYVPSLLGSHLVLLPDNDERGQAHADQVVQFQFRTAKSIRILDLPGLPAKGDVSDWLANGGSASLLKDLVRAIPRRRVERPKGVAAPLRPKEAYQQARLEAEKRAVLICKGAGLHFPWSQVDHLVGQLVPGQLVVLGGRAKQGKSTFLRECFSIWVQEHQKKVMLVGTEQADDEVRALWACQHLGLPPEAINQPDHQHAILQDILDRQATLQERALIYVPEKMDIDSLAELTHLAAEEKCDAVIFDHFTRLDLANKHSKWSEAGDAIKYIKKIARQEKMLIVTGAQLTDGMGPFGQFDVPTGSSWAYTRELQRECDVGCVIWRPLRRPPTNSELVAAKTDQSVIADLLESDVMAFRVVAHRLGGDRALIGGCRLHVENGRISGA